MIPNDSQAKKRQFGIQSAYLTYEITVEGGITRLLALYKDTEVEIYVSIWNYYPKSVRIKRNKTCVITFPSFYYPYTYLTCRVYLKEV